MCAVHVVVLVAGDGEIQIPATPTMHAWPSDVCPIQHIWEARCGR